MISAFIIAALSADGYIARSDQDRSTSWTSKEDREFFKTRTKEAGVVIMGSKTFDTIGKALPGRKTIVYSRQSKHYPPNVEVTAKEPRGLLRELEERGCKEVAICGGASVYTLFAKSGCISRLYLTIEPVIFGEGMRLFSEKFDLPLTLLSSKQLGSSSVLLEYEIHNGSTRTTTNTDAN